MNIRAFELQPQAMLHAQYASEILSADPDNGRPVPREDLKEALQVANGHHAESGNLFILGDGNGILTIDDIKAVTTDRADAAVDLNGAPSLSLSLFDFDRDGQFDWQEFDRAVRGLSQWRVLQYPVRCRKRCER